VFLLFVASSVCFSQRDYDNVDVDELFSVLDFKSAYYPEEAKMDLDSLLKHTSEVQFDSYVGYVDYMKAQFLFLDLDLDSSLVYLEKAISIFTVAENKNWLCKSQFLLGQIAETTGLYEQAKINYYESIALNSNDSDYLGFAYVGLARCKQILEESFSEELELGVHVLKSSAKKEVRLYGDFMNQLFDLKSTTVPDKLSKIALEYFNLGLYERSAGVYKVIASSYFAQMEIDSAHVYCDKAIELCEQKRVGDFILPALYQFKGVLYFQQELYNVAEVYLARSVELYKSHNQNNRLLYTYSYLHQINKAKKNFSKAYDDLKEYQHLLNETTSYEKIRMAKVLEINNKVDVMKSQLAQLKIEKKASEFMLYLVLVVTIVILAGVGIFFYLYQKNKRKKIDELNKEFQNMLIGIGEKQLLEHRLNKNVSREVIVGSNSISSEHVDLMGESDNVDDFDTCYTETISLFTTSFPQLTRTEVRYAVMICLRLPVEVIAKVQNVQPASIRKAKQRIRTKLNIGDNLEEYLQEFREKKIADLAG
jgi:tetratricopeptide (TPR) repeat protein